MVGWHHRLDGHEFEEALGVGDGQGSLACCSPWGRKEQDMTEQLNQLEIILVKNTANRRVSQVKFLSVHKLDWFNEPHVTVNFFHKQQYMISCFIFSPFLKFYINTTKQLSDIMPFHMEIFQCAFLTDNNCLAKSPFCHHTKQS